MRELLDARGAPGGPEVDHHDLALVALDRRVQRVGLLRHGDLDLPFRLGGRVVRQPRHGRDRRPRRHHPRPHPPRPPVKTSGGIPSRHLANSSRIRFSTSRASEYGFPAQTRFPYLLNTAPWGMPPANRNRSRSSLRSSGGIAEGGPTRKQVNQASFVLRNCRTSSLSIGSSRLTANTTSPFPL